MKLPFRTEPDIKTGKPMTAEAAQEDAPVFHPAGTAYPYPTVEVRGAFVGAYEDADGTLVVEVHPAPSDGPPAVAIRVADVPVLEEPGLSRGRHAKSRARPVALCDTEDRSPRSTSSPVK